MDFIVIAMVIALISILLAVILKIDVKKVKVVGENSKLNELAKKFPENKQICQKILKKLNNESVKIEEDKEAKNSLYIVATNKIIIANNIENFTRIQTIAHECIHSIQDKRILMFNFIYSNIYLLSFAIFLILGIINKLPNPMLFLNIFILMGIVFYVVRSYLENDAMYKARFLAEEYMEEDACCTKEEIQKIVEGFDSVNNLGIKGYNYTLLLGVLVKVLILCIVFLI